MTQPQRDTESTEAQPEADSSAPRIAKAINQAFERWTALAAPAVHVLGEADATTPVDVINRYSVKFKQTLVQGMGRGFGEERAHSRESLAQYAAHDIASMSSGLLDTVKRATATASNALTPAVSAEEIVATGKSAVCTSTCNTCAGSTRIVCPRCSGTLRLNCTLCIGGKTRCSACSGSGQVTTPCYSCGGMGGSYSAPATWDYQYQQDTWDYQKRQTAAGGQWQACVACGGRKGQQTSCSSCQYGQVTCSNCTGRGYNDCPQCNRTGQVTCHKCLDGYTHVSYAPQAEVKQTQEISVPGTPSAVQERVLKLAQARVADVGIPVDEPEYTRVDDTIARRHRWEIPAAVHSVVVGDKEYELLSVGGGVVDFGGMGDQVLDERLAQLETAQGPGEARKEVMRLHDLSLTQLAAKRLGFLVGLKSLASFCGPSEATVQDRFLIETSQFVSANSATRYITGMARHMKHALLTTVGLGFLVALIGSLGLLAWARYGAPSASITPTTLLRVAIFTPLLIAELVLCWRYIRNTSTAVLLAKNALHWLIVCAYVVLFVLSNGLLPPISAGG